MRNIYVARPEAQRSEWQPRFLQREVGLRLESHTTDESTWPSQKKHERESYATFRANELEEEERYISQRTAELLKGKAMHLPFGLILEPDPLRKAVAHATNLAFVQGWIESEKSFIDEMSTLSMMGDDRVAHSELW